MGKPATAAAPAPIRPLSTNQRVVLWARGKLGRQVGRGECWDLAEHALRQADALTSNDLMTKVEDDSDYVWGDAIENLKDVRPGDILQFRDHRVVETVTTVARFPDGAWAEETEETSMSRGHHTAIVENTPDADGAIGTFEQHVKPLGKVVQRKMLYTRDLERVQVRKQTRRHPASKRLEMASVTTTRSLVVTGRVWAYRPRPK